MPVGQRLFFALCSAVAAWFVWRCAAILWFPGLTQPLGYHGVADVSAPMVARLWALQGVVLFTFGALITWARISWLRHVLAGLIVFQYAVPLAGALARSRLPLAQRWDWYLGQRWNQPDDVFWALLWLVLIVLMFVPGNARWFRKPAAA